MSIETILIASAAGAISGFITAALTTRRLGFLMAATLTEVDDSIQTITAAVISVGAAVEKLGTDLTAGLAALEAKITPTTDIDYSSEFASLTTIGGQLTQIGTSLQNLDAQAIEAASFVSGTTTPAPTA